MIEFGMCKFLRNMNIFTLDSGVFDEDIVLAKCNRCAISFSDCFFLSLRLSLTKETFTRTPVNLICYFNSTLEQ